MGQFSFLTWKKSEVFFVVITTMVLLGVSFFQLKLGQAKTRDSQRKSDVELVARALNDYLAQLGILPPADSSGQIVACGYKAASPCVWGQDAMMDSFGVTYLKNIPKDPLSDQKRKYVYTVDEKRQKYVLYIALEVESDKSKRPDLTTECGSGLQCNWYVKN